LKKFLSTVERQTDVMRVPEIDDDIPCLMTHHAVDSSLQLVS